MRQAIIELYQRVALTRDLPEHNLCKGDVAVVVEHLPEPAPEGAGQAKNALTTVGTGGGFGQQTGGQISPEAGFQLSEGSLSAWAGDSVEPGLHGAEAMSPGGEVGRGGGVSHRAV